MLKNSIYLILVLIIPFLSIAQIPHKMNFQAVLRNSNNTIVTKSTVGIRISILVGSPTGQAIFIETHTVQTDYNGLMSLQIGNGISQLGSISSIDWSMGPYFLKTESDLSGGNSYSMSGTSELLSVPFALYALNAGSSTSGIPGPQGETGAIGTTGLNGLNGTNGIDGSNGLNGTNGLIGITGANGVEGAIGLTGDAGARGTTGLNGLNGTNGIDGSNGLNGTNGIDGTNAPNVEPIISVGSINQYYRGDKSWQILNANSVNLPYVENTSDLNKVISTNTQTALNLKSNLLSPEFAGIPRSTTAPKGTNSTQIATTEFVLANSNEAYLINGENELITSSLTDVVASDLSLSPALGKYLINYNAQIYIIPISTLQTSIDLADIYTTLTNKTATNSTHAATYTNETLRAGVYTSAGAVTANGTITLDGQNNPNAEFIFHFNGAFSTSADFNLLLTNGASACHVYWIADGAIALGANTIFQGTLIANNGAITLGNKSSITGGLFSTTGSISIDESSIASTTTCNNYSNTINKYGIFSTSGVITNLNQSIINGDIATHQGSISGFSSATMNGSVYKPGITSTSASFSFYQNGTFLPYSSRTISADSNSSLALDINTNAIIQPGDVIDVRWKVASGTVKMTNRQFSALKIR